MNDMAVVYIGIDVSKDTLDIDAGELGSTKIANAPAEVRKALGGISRRAQGRPLHACFESTGPYHGALAAECPAMGIAHSVLNPCKVACFAKSVANAKTDRIDAQARRPKPTPPPSATTAALDELVLAREATMRDGVLLFQGIYCRH